MAVKYNAGQVTDLSFTATRIKIKNGLNEPGSQIVDKSSHEGSCLCGEVSYTLQGDLLFLYHCHCVECRKFSGSSNATNATVVRADLTIHDPNQKLREFSLMAGGRYFCSDCGSPIYSRADDGEIVALHCGSLASFPQKELDANLWVSEKCPWTKIDENTHNFEKAPQ